MADLTLLPEQTRPRVNLADWMIRLGAAIIFLIAGVEKFSANPNSHWVSMFNRIGLGDWFRYFTAVVEIVGAALLLIPRTVTIGVVLLAVTMAGASVIVFLVLDQPGEGLFPALILVGLLALGWKQRNSAKAG